MVHAAHGTPHSPPWDGVDVWVPPVAVDQRSGARGWLWLAQRCAASDVRLASQARRGRRLSAAATIRTVRVIPTERTTTACAAAVNQISRNSNSIAMAGDYQRTIDMHSVWMAGHPLVGSVMG